MTSNTNRNFTIHPSVIKSIILEQAGDVCKALVELVMNSIDAQATYIDLRLDAEGYTLTDDGVGFKNKDQVLNYFGTFGAPHADDDGATYGVFRIGRGQALAISRTYWRSGHVGMDVDLNGLEGRSDVGYVVKEFNDFQPGCQIKGVFFEPLHKNGSFLNTQHFNDSLNETLLNFSRLADESNPDIQDLLAANLPKGMNNKFFARLFELLMLVQVPVWLNGVQISNRLKFNLYHESKTAKFYLFPKRSTTTGLYLVNQGVHIATYDYPLPCVIDFKVKPKLNMARNSISKDCKVFSGALIELRELGFQAVLDRDPHFKGLKDRLVQRLSSSSFSRRNVLDVSLFPTKMDIERLEEFLGLVSVGIVSVPPVKMTLLDLVNEMFDEPDEFVERFKKIDPYYSSSDSPVKKIQEHLALSGEQCSVLNLINGRAIQPALFENLDELYHSVGYYLNLSEIYNEVEFFKIPKDKGKIKLAYKNSRFVYGDYKEVTALTYTQNQDLIELLTKLMHKIRVYLISYMPNLNILQKHVLADTHPIEIRLMSKSSKSSYQCFGDLGCIMYGYHDDKHLFALNYQRLKSDLKALGAYSGYFMNSVAVYLYLGMMESDQSFVDEANKLHDLRKKNEAFLFDHPEFRDFLHRLDMELVSYIHNIDPPKIMTAKAMKGVQKQMEKYKLFFDNNLGGLSPDLNATINEILAVEVN